MYCPKCGTLNIGNAEFCINCGNSLMVNQAASGYNSNPVNYPVNTDLYSEFFRVESLPIDVREKQKKHNFENPMDYGWGLLFHYLTMGIFTFFNYGSKYSRLPVLTNRDFKSGKAIGYLFIPFYNFYWIFIFQRHLAKRINYQFKLRNEPEPVSVALATSIAIFSVIPYLGFVVNYLFLWPILYVQVQQANKRLFFNRQ